MSGLRDIVLKYVKYSLVSTIGFLLSTFIFFFATMFNLGWLSWFVANIIGGIWAFLVFYFKIDIFHSFGRRTKSGAQAELKEATNE